MYFPSNKRKRNNNQCICPVSESPSSASSPYPTSLVTCALYDVTKGTPTSPQLVTTPPSQVLAPLPPAPPQEVTNRRLILLSSGHQ